MRRLLLLAALVAAIWAPLFIDQARAQTGTPAQTVSSCGTPNNTPVAGLYYSLTQDTALRACGNVVISSGNFTAETHAQTSALAASLTVKASAGTLFDFTVSADSTLNAAQWYIMIFDATSLPADGAVTPAKCYAVPQSVVNQGATFDTGGVAFTTGIVIGVSTTGCFSKTASVHALFIGADFQ